MKRFVQTGILVVVASLALALPASAEPVPAWQAADDIQEATFEAQKALFGFDGTQTAELDEAVAFVGHAQATYHDTLQPDIAAQAPEVDEFLAEAFELAGQAAATGDAQSLALARGRIGSGLVWGGYELTQRAIEAGDAEAAARWLALREYRRATRVSVVESEAGPVLEAWQAGELTADEAGQAVGGELRDAVFFRLRDALAQVGDASEQGYSIRAAEWAGQAEGYALLLHADMAAQMGSSQADLFAASLVALQEDIRAADWEAVDSDLAASRALIIDYEPVALSGDDLAHRIQLLYLFIDLIYVEYRDGVRNGEVTIETEYLEAVTFRDQAEAVYAELRPRMVAADPQATERLGVLLDELDASVGGVEDRAIVEAQVNESLEIVENVFGEQAITQDVSATFDIVFALLGESVAHARRGDYAQAEVTRIQAYAMFDAGPELRLLGVAPELAARIDGLFWQGYKGQPGFGTLYPTGASVEEIEALYAEMETALGEAEGVLTNGAAPLAVILNSAVIVFREGLETVIILVALLASMARPEYRRYRRPLVAGAAFSLVATALTWIIARRLLDAFSQFGERLEAVVGLVAIGVLLLILNWFFHKVYWQGWMARFHKVKGNLLRAETGQIIGLMLLGFASAYREGFETVLFLQALVLDAGATTVLNGVLLGVAGVAIVGYLTFTLERKLPYMHMLVATGVLIGVVLVTMVGHTIHVTQAIGWVPVAPIRNVSVPHWLGLWFGVYPTWQVLVGQVAAAAFVISSYYLARAQKGAKGNPRARGRFGKKADLDSKRRP